MYRILNYFEYFEPMTVDEMLRLLSKYGAEAKPIAGGVDLVLKMRLRQLMPKYVISLQKLPGLDYIDGGGREDLKFGALVTLRSIELSPIIRKDWALLYEAIHQIASVQVKTMGTVVGNLCVATPASDIAPVLIVLGAKVKITGVASEKVIPVEHLFVAVGKTILEPHEIVTEVLVPSLPVGTGGAFMQLAKTADDIAKVNVAAVVTIAHNKCVEARIALGSVAPVPVRAIEAEAVLKGQELNKKTIVRAAEAAAESVKPITDVRSTALYRKEMVKVLVRDALGKAVVRASM